MPIGRSERRRLAWRIGTWTDTATPADEAVRAALGDDAPTWESARAEAERQRFAVGRMWALELATELGFDVSRGFERSRRGRRPEFAGHSTGAAARPSFSIAHAGDHLLVAVSAQSVVGVDLESETERAFESGALRRRMCSTAELARVESLHSAERPRALARLWTAKEAYLKATGRGLARDPRTVDVARLSRAPGVTVRRPDHDLRRMSACIVELNR